MNNINITKLILVIMILTLVKGCRVSNRITFTNLSYLYPAIDNALISGVRLFNENDTITRVYLQYNTAGLQFRQQPDAAIKTSNYRISYGLFSSYESDVIIDSASFTFSDTAVSKKDITQPFEFTVNASSPGTYLLLIQFEDLNRDYMNSYPYTLFKNSDNSPHNYLITDDKGEVRFDNRVSVYDKIRIITSLKDKTYLYITHYPTVFSAAAPPFSTVATTFPDMIPDEIKSLTVTNQLTEEVALEKTGLWVIRADTTETDGLMLICIPGEYTFLTGRQKCEALRYLTSNDEYRQLLLAEDPEQAADNFWIQNLGNAGRASEVSSEYYSRTVYANHYFTSFKEGWKTDRGMAYIIFGAPTRVFRRSDIETWIYETTGKSETLIFDFYKSPGQNPDNDYILQRRPDLKIPWFQAVETWRR